MAKANTPAQERVRVSFRLDNFSAGGVCPEGDYEVKGASFVLFNYTTADGKPTGNVTTALQLDLQPLTNGQPTGDALQQIYSVGDPERFVPSEDGCGLEAVGSSLQPSKSSNFFIWLQELVNAGFPEDKFDNDSSIFIGYRGHIVHIPAPERNIKRESSVLTGQAQPEKKREFPKTIPVFKSTLPNGLPWEASKRKGGAATKPAAGRPTTSKPAATAPAPEPEVAEGGNERLAEMIKSVVTGAGGKLDRTQTRLQVHRAYNQAKIPAAERDAELVVFSDQTQLEAVLGTINCLLEGNTIEMLA